MCDYKYFLITFRKLYLAFTLCTHHVSFIMNKLQNRFQKHTAKAILAGRLVSIHALFALLFANISILCRQNPFSIHSPVKTQEEQISMPKQDLQNLGDEARFPRAQKNRTIYNIFHSDARVDFLLLCKNPMHWRSRNYRSPYCMQWKIPHLWRVPRGHAEVTVAFFWHMFWS